MEPESTDGWFARRLRAPAGLFVLLVLSCIATGVSIGLQGYYYAVVNNSYHIPIVDGWMDDPQFATDQLIQSLRYHTSFVWPLAHLVAKWLGTYNTFVLLHVANRLAMFVGMALLIRELGTRSVAGVSAAVMTLAVTRYLLAASGPGDHDLFMPFLNHSSLTWPFMFASWIFLVRGQVMLALALQGPVFAVNAFVAICGGPAIAAGTLVLIPADRRARLIFLGKWVAGLGLSIAIAAPTMLWILRSFTDQPAAEPFSFIGFLKSYYVNHWFITAAAPRRLISFVLVCGCGLAGLVTIGKRARSLVWVWCGYLLLFVAGVALPFLADSRVLLDLHPMRVGAGCLVMLSVIAIVAHVGRVLETDASSSAEIAAAGFALFCLAVGQAALVAMAISVAFIVILSRRTSHLAWSAARQPTVWLALAVGLFAVTGWRAWREPAPYDLYLLADARDVGLWLREHTPEGSMIFVPSGAVAGADDPVSVWARRPLWYDWKEGAAVMWTPHYFQEWSTRRVEAAALRSVDDVINYACKKRIDYVVESDERMADPELRRRLESGIRYANARYSVLAVASLCAGRS